MRKSTWIALLFGLTMFSAAGVSFAQLHSTAAPLFGCHMHCTSDDNCLAITLGHCPVCDGGVCVATFVPQARKSSRLLR